MNKLLFAPLLALGLGACAPTQSVVQVPTFEVQSVRLTRLSLPSGPNPALANLTLRLRVQNPNPLPLRLANFSARLVIDGQDVGRLELPNVALPARGEALQDANLALPVTLQTAGAFLEVARGRQVSYRVDGSFAADLGVLGQPTFGPFTLAQGLWQQPAILPF
ncbi:LEA type 2 family protein [Deinococcus budaensis]|uniref:LEA14-like dessication related protein n=1 Tax=Deinococcus budaensis TaxID=1665626 RepID=A0A7W8GDA4_9DEIO|nr:LEA type 2 family protein [Deinococcus budaensis]MBB5233441.1 LEA14-like dessication related protein [Deinococcus budaensis]